MTQSNSRKIILFNILLTCLLVSNCANSTKPSGSKTAINTTIGTASEMTQDGIQDAALQPLSDLNIRQEQIPDILRDMWSPYMQVPMGCDTIAEEVRTLTELLGPDVDSPHVEKEDISLLEEAGEEAGEEVANFALDTVRDVTNIIPFRSVVRRATGAKKHDKQVRRAYERGISRRAYLKGIGLERGCLSPAAPEPQTFVDDKAKIEYRKTTPH